MSFAFVHISDIHFGQEKGGQTVVDDDVKESIIEDCRQQFAAIPPHTVRGIIATGDIAFAGRESDYRLAGEWFDKLTQAIGCLRSNVFVVPGNHDIDRTKISQNCADMLAAIATEGDARLDKYLVDSGDREQLFRRFDGYRLFAEGYDCSIDDDGGLAGDHPLEISSGRILRFVGLNSALICGASGKEEGRLLLGQRQRVVQRNREGEELVILMHHPLHWLQDSEDASDYMRSRARIVISGHEHSASSKLVTSDDGKEVLMISAGATVPPAAEGKRYCFNIIKFDWDVGDEKLVVNIQPREWHKTRTAFAEGTATVGGEAQQYVLKCPNYVSAGAAVPQVDAEQGASEEATPDAPLEEHVVQNPSITSDDDEYSLLVLSFFRDIDESDRLSILVQLNLIPETFNVTLTHALERSFLDKAKEAGRVNDLKVALEARITK